MLFKKNPNHQKFRPRVKWFFHGAEFKRVIGAIFAGIKFIHKALTYKPPQVENKRSMDELKPVFRGKNPVTTIRRTIRRIYKETERWSVVFLRNDIQQLWKTLTLTIPRIRLHIGKTAVSAALLFFIGHPAPQSPVEQPVVRIGVALAKPPGIQAALYPFHASPFYYAFRTKPTSMNKLEPFSQIANAKHNSHGFRSVEYTLAHPPDVFRIVVIGDEVTYGTSVRLTETFSYQMADLLNQQCKQTRFEVIPLGGLGHRLADNFIKLGVHGQTLKPDLVLFQFSYNDVEFFNYRSSFLIRGGKMQDMLPFMSRTIDDVMNRNSMDRKVFQESLQAIQEWSRNQAVAVAFVIFPLVDNDPRGRNFSRYDPNDRRAPLYLSKLPELVTELNATGLPFLDLTAFFREHVKDDQYLAVSSQDASPNSFTHHLAARGIADFLKQNKLISCPARVQPSGKHWEIEAKLRKKASQKWAIYNKDYRQQLDFYTELSELYPRDAWTISLLADVYYGLEQWEDASRMFASLTDLAPEFSAPWYQLAQCNYIASEKIKLLEQMLHVVHTHNLAMEQLADYYIRSNQIPESCALLAKLLEMPVYQNQYEVSLKMYTNNDCEKHLAVSRAPEKPHYQ